MNFAKRLDRLRYYAAITGFGLSAGIFWGAVAAVVAKRAFGLEEMRAWLFVGLPVGIVFVMAIWKKLPGLLGLDE
jgi:hypothetical protein